METRANYATIGLFTLIVIALGFGFVYWLKRYDEVGARKELRLEFDGTVNGLAKGGVVYFNGIKVGVVSSLTFDPNDPRRVIVVASIAQTTPVKPDTRAEVNFNFLTGVAYVELFGGSLQAEDILAQPGIPTLHGVPSSLTDVISGANRMFKSAEKSIDSINAMVAEVTPSITQSIKNVEEFTDALAGNADGVKEFLANVSEMSKTVGALSGKLEGLVEHADQTISAIDADKVRSTLDSAQSFMKRIDDASAEIGPIVADVRKVASDFSGFSTSLNTTLADLQGVIGAFDRQKIETSLDGISSFAGKLGNASNDFDEIIADAKEAADNVNKFTSNVQSHTADVDTIIAQAKQLTTRVNAASARLDGLLGKADQFLGTEGGENFFTEAASAARAIREAAEAVSRQTNAVGGGLAKFSGPGLDNMQALINELRGSVARIDRAVSAISRDPSSVVFGSGGNSGVREYNRR
jgi:phospholipid/cholesterol/gamma-HCH transport system substrate-binding protein